VNIVVKAPLKTDDIQKLVDGYSEKGLTFTFLNRRGFEMEYEVSGESLSDPIDMVKSLIKSTDYGRGLYFSVVKK